MPPDDRGGGGGGGGGSSSSERRKNLLDGQSYGDEPGLSVSATLPPDPEGQVDAQEGGWGDGGTEGGGGGMGGNFFCAAGDAAGGGAGGVVGGGEGGSAAAAGGGSGLLSESLPPEIFYSMKLVTGKDAVGTMSGPGTLGIERCGKGEGGGGRRTAVEEGRSAARAGKRSGLGCRPWWTRCPGARGSLGKALGEGMVRGLRLREEVGC